MVRLCKNRGFSLTEVLLSVGILAVGMIFIAGVFPVAIHFTTIATERSIAAVVADEAFAKIKLYGKDNPAGGIDFGAGGIEINQLKDFNDVLKLGVEIDSREFTYPSTDVSPEQKQYFWSVLCRRVGADPNRLVQVTVFVSRRVSPNLKYPDPSGLGTVDRPKPVKVKVLQGDEENELDIEDSKKTFINDGYTIVDNETGRIYRVLERYRDKPKTILLDRDWQGSSSGSVWVVPPPLAPGTSVGDKQCSGRYPCIAVYQKGIRF